MVDYAEAREIIIRRLERVRPAPVIESVPLAECLGRVLAENVVADRDYPPFDRSTRDGFALRSCDVEHVPVELKLVGEVKAGDCFSGKVGAGECVQIMTGAPVPAGADAVVMIEHTDYRDGRVTAHRSALAGHNLVSQGSEASAGALQLAVGRRIGYAEVAVLGQVGKTKVPVFRRPRAAVLSTGDEVVSVSESPGPYQIRNSNSYSLAAQIRLAGGEPVLLGNARDETHELERLLLRGLDADLLVITGGVSMGKYDLVEEVLKGLGAEFFFDAVAIRPGRPAVFGQCREKFVFGLPGNPLSTMVTFELLVAPAVAMLAGTPAPALRYHVARLADSIAQNPRLTLFAPARIERRESEVWVRPLHWKSSGDVSSLAQSDCFLVVPPGSGQLEPGSWVKVLLPLGGAP